MLRMDELHLNHPYAGSRLLRDLPRREGVMVGRKHVRTLMLRMGIERNAKMPVSTPLPTPSTPSNHPHDFLKSPKKGCTMKRTPVAGW